MRTRISTGTLSKILVVGVHADRSVRGQFENTVARTLRSVGASSEASLYSVGNTGELSAETLIAAARTVRADAVMVTRVVDVQTQNPDVTASLQDYFRKYAAYEDPLPGTAKHTVRVRTDLYLVDSQAQTLGCRIDGVRETRSLCCHRRHRQGGDGAAS